VVYTYNSSYEEGRGRKMVIQVSPGQKWNTSGKKKKTEVKRAGV
jgi:hypothetical protein